MRAAFASLLFLSACSFAHPPLSKKVVLDVDGHQLTAQQFAQELAFQLKDQDALTAKDPKVVAAAKARICDDFIVQTLSEEWAKDHSLILKAEDLEARIKEYQSSYPDDLAFQQALAEEGLSFQAWRDRLKQTLLQKLVVGTVAAQITPPTEAEMQTYYNEHKARFSNPEAAQVRQILVATESDATAIEAELKQGKKMTDLAKKFSISPEGPTGGNVGWLEKGASDVFEPAFRMKLGQRSPVIKSSFGYHIFELTGRKPAHSKAYKECRDEIKRILMEKREQSLYLAWLEQQTRKARVFKDQDFIDALKVETKVQ